MCLGDGGQAQAQEQAELQRAQEQARQGRVRAGKNNIDSTFAGYDDDFYDSRTQSYIDYEKPEVADQFKDATLQLRAALSRNGMLQSSVSADQTAKLSGQNSDALRSVADKGREYSNNTRKNIENAKANLIAQNQSLADPVLAANLASSRAASAAEIPSYSPIAQLFGGVTSGLANQAQLERREQARYGNVIGDAFDRLGSARIIN